MEESEFKERAKFYKENGISVVARPAHNRAGLFKKASNLNYTYMINELLQVRQRPSDKQPGVGCSTAVV